MPKRVITCKACDRIIGRIEDNGNGVTVYRCSIHSCEMRDGNLCDCCFESNKHAELKQILISFGGLAFFVLVLFLLAQHLNSWSRSFLKELTVCSGNLFVLLILAVILAFMFLTYACGKFMFPKYLCPRRHRRIFKKKITAKSLAR